MTPDEINTIAAQVAREVVRRFGGANTLGAEAAEFECFTCSGRFRCRPSFMITTSPAPTGGGTSGG